MLSVVKESERCDLNELIIFNSKELILNSNGVCVVRIIYIKYV